MSSQGRYALNKHGLSLKTERHFDVTLDELKNGGRVTEEQIAAAREMLAEYERQKQKSNENPD